MKRFVVAFIVSLNMVCNAQDVLFVPASYSSIDNNPATSETPSNIYDPLFAPPAPVITTDPSNLEVCAGYQTTLSAEADDEIFWYLTPPPLGKPVGKGNSFVTPTLEQGYYVYYAITHNDQSYSNFTSIDIVMVYPLPVISIMSSHEIICAGESATISVRGSSNLIWSSGGTLPEQEIRPRQNTTYTVSGTNTAGCKNTAIYTQKVEDCTSLSEKNNTRAEMNVYPNPTNGEFHIALNVVADNSKIEVYNSLGQLVHDVRIESTNSIIHLGSAPSGIYMIKLVSDKQIIGQGKIVKE
jgi:hypothetical protein